MTSNTHKWLTVSLSEERYHHKRCPVVGNYSIWLIQHYHVIVLFILSRFQNLDETKSQERNNWPSSPKMLLIQASVLLANMFGQSVDPSFRNRSPDYILVIGHFLSDIISLDTGINLFSRDKSRKPKIWNHWGQFSRKRHCYVIVLFNHVT